MWKLAVVLNWDKISCYFPGESEGKHNKPSDILASLWAEISTRDLPNTKQECKLFDRHVDLKYKLSNIQEHHEVSGKDAKAKF